MSYLSDTVIRVENLSKKYVLGHQQKGHSKYKSLGESISNEAKSLCKKLFKPAGKEMINRAVKRYSSGIYVPQVFAVAGHLKP